MGLKWSWDLNPHTMGFILNITPQLRYWRSNSVLLFSQATCCSVYSCQNSFFLLQVKRDRGGKITAGKNKKCPNRHLFFVLCNVDRKLSAVGHFLLDEYACINSYVLVLFLMSLSLISSLSHWGLIIFHQSLLWKQIVGSLHSIKDKADAPLDVI